MKTILFITMITGSITFAKSTDNAKSAQQAAVLTANTSSEIKVGVKGMVCSFCAQGIEKSFLKQPEVSSIDVSLENKYIKLKFKEGKALTQDKISSILKEAGYESVFGE